MTESTSTFRWYLHVQSSFVLSVILFCIVQALAAFNQTIMVIIDTYEPISMDVSNPNLKRIAWHAGYFGITLLTAIIFSLFTTTGRSYLHHFISDNEIVIINNNKETNNLSLHHHHQTKPRTPYRKLKQPTSKKTKATVLYSSFDESDDSDARNQAV